MSDKNKNTGAATAAEPAKEKAPAGSSFQAQAKVLLRAIDSELDEHISALNSQLEKGDTPFSRLDFLTEGTSEWLKSVATKLLETVQRGLTPAERLKAVNEEINKHYASLPVVDGKAQITPDWEAETKRLMTKRDNVQRSIKKAAEAKTEAASSEEATPK